MDIERLKELADCDVFIGGNPIIVDRAQETLRTLIDEATKTETTGCHYCIGIESHGIVAVKTVIDEYLRVIPAYDTPYNYCPNCGRKIKEQTGWTERKERED